MNDKLIIRKIEFFISKMISNKRIKKNIIKNDLATK